MTYRQLRKKLQEMYDYDLDEEIMVYSQERDEFVQLTGILKVIDPDSVPEDINHYLTID